jgi:hypothetical protein
MNVFELDQALVSDYERFARSFTLIRAPDIQQQVEELYASDRFWPEPLVSINPRFERGDTINRLVANGTLHSAPRCRPDTSTISCLSRYCAPPFSSPFTKPAQPGSASMISPEGTGTHVPIPHHEIVELVRYTLGFYVHEIAEEHHAVTPDGARYFHCAALTATLENFLRRSASASRWYCCVKRA